MTINLDRNTLDAINDIYHSTDPDVMKIKVDLHNVNLNDIRVIMCLIDTTVYHHAFWPHTAQRFEAFKKLLKEQKDLTKNPKFHDLIEEVKKNIDEIILNKWKSSTPGGKQELKNYRQVLKILESLKK